MLMDLAMVQWERKKSVICDGLVYKLTPIWQNGVIDCNPNVYMVISIS
jgi:hypothetical protein